MCYLLLQLTDARTQEDINQVTEMEEFVRLQAESGSVRLPTVSASVIRTPPCCRHF